MESLKTALKLKEKLDSLRPLKVEDELRIMQKFRLDWNYHSNNLEGNSLTYGETKALILFGITAQGKPFRDSLEVNGHNEAVEWILEIVKKDRPLTESFIRELHEVILQKPYEVDAITPDGKPAKKLIQIGKYKTTPNHVKTKTGEIFRFASPEETPSKMGDLLGWYNTKIQIEEFNPIIVASEFHYRFIRIHPFDDGNGRTARILMNFILMQHNYPPVVIKTEDKENYFAVLRQADAGILEPFIEYITQNLIHSLEIMISGALGENIEEPDDLDKELALLEQKVKEVSKPIKYIKNEANIKLVYRNSISKLSDFFFEKQKKFNRFYLNNGFWISIDGESLQAPLKKRTLYEFERRINFNSKSINIKYVFFNFLYTVFEDVKYSSEIKFVFNTSFYEISSFDNKLMLKKKYNEALELDEINQLVNLEVKKHKEFIEKKLEEHKKQNE